MNIEKRTVAAIIMNVVLPGAGYLYIGAKSRRPLAIFLLFITLYEIVRTLIAASDGNIQMYEINISPLFPALNISALGIMSAAVLSVDTYFLAKKGASNRTVKK